MIICGIDEAGRGPVIGPLVMCGVLIEEEEEKRFSNIGARDSKLLSPVQREDMYEKIINIAKDYKVIITSENEIDNAVLSETTNLNWLEAGTIAEIINTLKPDMAYVDCPSNNISAFTQYLKSLLKCNTKIIAEHKADTLHPSVSAASIIAKVTRDKEISKLKQEHNIEFGSGYPSDPRTVEFLRENYDKYPIFRKSWVSWKRVAEKKDQKNLSEF